MGKPVSNVQEDIEIEQFLKRVIKRDCTQRAWKLLGIYGLVGSGLWFVSNFITLIVPFYYGGIMAVMLILIAACVGVVHFLLCRPDEKKAARLADNTGLKERISTALEGRGSEEPLRILQREDACRNIRGFSFAKRMPYVYPWKQYIVTWSLLLLGLLAAVYPSSAKTLAKQKHQFAVAAATVEDKMDKTEKELKKQADEGKIDEELQRQIEEAFDTAKKEIGEAKDIREIAAAEERLETKVLRNVSETMSKETAESLQPFVKGKDLASLAEYQQRLTQLAQSGNAVTSAMDELKSLGELLEDSEMENLLKTLEKAAEDGDITNTELASALNDLNNANASYASVSITKNSGNRDNVSVQSSDPDQKNNQNGQQGTGQQGGSPQDDSQGNSQGEGQQGNGNGQQGGQGNSQGEGQQGDGNGQQGGQGNGQGEGQQGNGQNGGAGFGGGMNRGDGEGMERANTSNDVEKVWIPDSIGNDENLTGQKSGTSQNKTKAESQNAARAGQKADIGSVSGQYQQKAYSKLDKQKVPESKQNLVKEYFSGLE